MDSYLFKIVSLFTAWLVSTVAMSQMPPALVQVASARTVSIVPVQDVPATVYSVNRARIAAEVDSRLLEILQAGAAFEPGDVLARLDGEDYMINLEEAQAVVSREQARLEYLDKEVSRLTGLSESDHASKRQLEQAQSERDMSMQELQAGKARLRRARFDLGRLNIKAPFGGIVTRRIRQPGEWVAEGDDVIAVADPANLEIRAQASALNLPYLSTGQSIEIGDTHQKGTATILSIVNVGDAESGLYEIILQPDSAVWYAGQSLRISLPTQEVRSVLAVPRDALVIRRDGISVFRIADNKSEKIEIQTGVASGDLIEAIGNLNDGDQIVIRGNERLRPGQDVQIKSAPDFLQ